MCISPKKRSQFEGNVGNPTKRNWKLGGIIKNKCYLCKGNRKKIELFNPYEMASVHIAALNG